MERDRWSRPVIEAAAEVHRILGPGLPESVYKLALPEELRRRKIPFEQDKTVPIRYRDLVLVTGLQLELVVGGELIVEVVSVERVTSPAPLVALSRPAAPVPTTLASAYPDLDTIAPEILFVILYIIISFFL